MPTGDLGEAVDLTVASPARLNRHTIWLHDVPEGFLDQSPALLSRFFAALMERTPEPFYGAYYLIDVLRELVAREGDWTPVREAALRLRISLE